MSPPPALSSAALQFPFTLYQTKNQFDDYHADDMRYGDLSENCLKAHYNLNTIVEGVDPWRGEVSAYPLGNYSFARPVIISETRRHAEIARILFDQFRRFSWPMSFIGHRGLILDLINHMQTNIGTPFDSSELDTAYYIHILNDKSDKSSLAAIGAVLKSNIDWDNKYYPFSKSDDFNTILKNTILPKFNRWQDRLNGLGVSVHDVFATQITFQSLHIADGRFRAMIHYKGQDHFGLDEGDIMNHCFHNIPLFRIWFLLQHWEKFAFRPFMTNMSATVEISGERSK
ncbi:DUF3289 family protein [Pantoea sp. B65]|uniref:DUF3289 family protein n=1 Tax=Pantoea sp. B65 TaxID=2813359 RepID=UPI0039B4C576